jgi:DNA modification methylase
MIINGNNIEELKKFNDNYFDSIVTDPPYEIGFMGKSWDASGIANNPEMWSECLRVLKPGGYLLSFSATRTYHRMAVAIEDSGFEIRDMIEWVYGSGFPKSLNIGKAVDKIQGNERQVVGEQKLMGTARRMKGGNFNDFGGEDTADVVSLTKGTSEFEGKGTALKPAHEPICMARKPLAEKTVAENVLKYGTGGINIDESRVGMTQDDMDILEAKSSKEFVGVKPFGNTDIKGSALKPNTLGRFPANLIHDNSEEVRECFPDTGDNCIRKPITNRKKGYKDYAIKVGGNSGLKASKLGGNYNDGSGNASRFFKSIIYQAKASKSERNKGCEELEDKNGGALVGNNIETQAPGNKIGANPNKQVAMTKNNHPTVKPIALMEYLIKMVTPTNGIVLDPFMGSGSTGVACVLNDFEFVGIDLDKDYCEIARVRIEGTKETQTKMF